MALTEEQILELEEAFVKDAHKAFAEAFRKAISSGQSVLIAENGYIYRAYPDGTRKRIKPCQHIKS